MLRTLIERLYSDFEVLSEDFEELTDTDVREALHMVLNYYFVFGKNSKTFPVSYGMFSLEADKKLSDVINRFIVEAKALPELMEYRPGESRLRLLQDPSIKTPEGRQYDDFIGHSESPLSASLPEDLFEEGDYDNEFE